MSDTLTSEKVVPVNGARRAEWQTELRSIVAEAGALLPSQGPISAFAFLNTLQALEHLPFDEGLQLGAKLYGSQPYMSEDYYRHKLTRGRKRVEDLSAVLMDDLGDSGDVLIGYLGTRFHLRLAMLQFPIRHAPMHELQWLLEESDALRRFRPDIPTVVRERTVEETRHWVMRDLRNGVSERAFADDWIADRAIQPRVAELIEHFGSEDIEQWSNETWEAFCLHLLWEVCHNGVSQVPKSDAPHPLPIRHRDLLLEASGQDSDPLVHGILIRFCSAFMDQGFAGWALPHRERGFYRAFLNLYGGRGGPPDAWMRGLRPELERVIDSEMSPLESIEESLELLGVSRDETSEFITASLLALRGFAGMIWQLETRPDRAPLPVKEDTLIEFLAVRLILERIALAYVARRAMKYRDSLVGLRDFLRQQLSPRVSVTVEQRVFLVLQLAQARGWLPRDLNRMSVRDWSALIREIDAFSAIERRRILHAAFERRFRTEALDAVLARVKESNSKVKAPRLQLAFCIDAREESFRRHLEEIAPDVETFGTAGFYGVAMYFRGAADAHFAALCPIVVFPKHWVVEDVVYSLEDTHRRRAKARRALGTATHHFHVGSRSFAGGAVLTAGLGVLASVPLVARILFPRLTARLRETASRFVEPPLVTRLRIERTAANPSPDEEGIGYSVDEMADVSERALGDIGLTSNFARMVIFLGHGASCLNNPHESAYNCGACSGNAGGPNARALAMMLNDIRVRQILSERGLPIPATTYFIGGLHNTTNDSVLFYDLDLMPRSHLADFESARDTLARTCERNAHERCRRFESAPLNLSHEAALRHVQDRAEDLAQTRPEYGNSTNAMCIVGRRSRIRGLYLDRRSFLMSYDPTQDNAESAILARILSAVVPVCSGINLQYTLSYIDNQSWGCGTKLPHNVTSMLGVMDGAASDLRPGLPWQGVDIHDPVRLLFVIETTPDSMLKIMQQNPVVGRILRNGWAQLATLDPDSSTIRCYRNGRFEVYRPETEDLPRVDTSIDWYRGWREHLGFAFVQNGLPEWDDEA